MLVQYVIKICFCGDYDDLCCLWIQLNEMLGDCVFFCFLVMDCLEVLLVGCNKGVVLVVFSQYLGFILQECMVFGDVMNDCEMLGSVGWGFIMGNVMLQLKVELLYLLVIGDCWNQVVFYFLIYWLDNFDFFYFFEQRDFFSKLDRFLFGFFYCFLIRLVIFVCQGVILLILFVIYCGL